MSLNTFIQRPILSSVCSFLFILGGLICLKVLPVEQYPNIAPPQIKVSATYSGASAETVESAVTIPIEKQINGAEGVKYITSQSSDNGTAQITVVFEPSRNLDDAIVDIQNRVKQAEPRLPDEVRKAGIQVAKYSSSILLVAGFYAENGKYDKYYISNYVDRYVSEPLKRVKGVGEITIFGERKYAMRLWLDPSKMASVGLIASDVVKALQEQNVQVAPGQIGQAPCLDGQPIQLPIKVKGRLNDAQGFNNIVLKRRGDGTLIKVKDVGKAELGAEDYGMLLRFNGNEDTVGMMITQLPGSNALEVSKKVNEELKKISSEFPPGLKLQVAFNPTEFVQKSIHEVVHTLVEAILLVILVIFIFMQDFKTVLIPTITVPVSLIGTFIFIKLFGFSINTLTLFGLTLATGLVVDDAIIVLENIERLMAEKGLTPLEAAFESMKEITGAVIATSLVLMAVFIPVAFFPGSTGQLYRQFALTIAFSIAISMFNALTLAPALSAILLKHEHKSKKNAVFQFFDNVIEGSRFWYSKFLFKAFRFQSFVVIGFFASLVLMLVLFKVLPQGFVPTDDQGYLIVNVQTPSGSSLESTTKTLKEAEKIILNDPDMLGTFTVGGFSFLGAGPNKGLIFAVLKPLEEREGNDHSANAVLKRIKAPLFSLSGGVVSTSPPPALPGLGSFGGFQYELKVENAGIDASTLSDYSSKLVSTGNKQKELSGLFTGFTASDPQLFVEADREKIKALGINLVDVFSTMQIYLGALYINDFELMNRIYRVYAQADKQFRSKPEDIVNTYVRAENGGMVPLSNLVKVDEIRAPGNISHFNLLRSVEVIGAASPGYSSGQAMLAMDRISKQVLPPGMSYEWAGLAREQMEAGSQTVIIFLLGIVFVFLILAAQYESLVDPLIILMAVPLAIFGGLLGQFFRGLENDVFCQVGLLMLVGLASKNAILIVEFANQLQLRGYGIMRGVIKSCKARYRPIMMTSLAFIFGIWPLVVAKGAGAYSRHSLGTVVFGGMIVSTLLSLFVVPIIYLVVGTIRKRFACPKAQPNYSQIKAVET